MDQKQIFNLKAIKEEKDSLLENIAIAQARVTELNEERQNIIMNW